MGDTQERYTHGHGVMVDSLSRRTASHEAGFFIPYLRAGMALIDCGCGPGAITVDLAKVVSPGQVVGIDMEPSVLERGRAAAADRGVHNVRFETSSIYTLPFADETFDAAFAHTVLQHLKDPVAALKEIRRTLKPGGVVGFKEEDGGSMVLYPTNSLLEESAEIYKKRWMHNGGDPELPRRYRAILREAGFSRVELTASASLQATQEATKELSQLFAQNFLEPVVAEPLIELGWADRGKLEKFSLAWEEWGDHPDSLMGLIHIEAVAWKE